MVSLNAQYVSLMSLPEDLDRDIYIDYLQKAVRRSAAQASNLLCCVASVWPNSPSTEDSLNGRFISNSKPDSALQPQRGVRCRCGSSGPCLLAEELATVRALRGELRQKFLVKPLQ
uniref:Uncharacterized protein n=1 Tax=Zea mays TaxID=4577 RepID=C0PCR8_MAIZE|nr:unknown [Zea mays]